ncbi:Planctomycete cytochrome C [Polystyrenella longa]|uniref:Planctomycete cytochrome C n=1 Tax=Polystyrenella longa TaxID=2528007 RepID=A0A518CKS5_9PLAN|nr:DUF1553 domain-containing protein [Polystyrenella longa]QDU79784.1 Planctomycete cytochrome C [Polystyrenella longa]
MFLFFSRYLNLLLLVSVYAIAVYAESAVSLHAAETTEQVDFNFHIRPILSDRCFACHGPDQEKRQADLRLDIPDQLNQVVDEEAGIHYVVPGKPELSELFRRVDSHDEFEVMPPADSNLTLSEREIDLLKKWIEQGAEWKSHWSFIPLETVEIPEVKQTNWPQSRIDYFVLNRLEKEGLSPSSPVSREQWIRRVSFDLTGLPPTPEEIDTFLNDQSEEAYATVVDRLLASPQYGERMAVDWLDVARYADTYGYQSDVYRAMWPWRDWVIDAFNENLPYDEFITWQLAGDLLPKPSRDQILATAFNRHHRQTNEGGSIEEEFRVEYVSDRTQTYGTAFLGLTLECSKCHDHKYDPITQKEFYQLSSYFNSIDEFGLYSHFTDAVPTPTLMLPEAERASELERLNAGVEQAEQALESIKKSEIASFANWLGKQDSVPSSSDADSQLAEGLIGQFSFDKIQVAEGQGRIDNLADDATFGELKDDPQQVPGFAGQALKFSGENNFSTTVGGDFQRSRPFTISLWMKADRRHERAVIFHRSAAWTDAGSRGYQLLLEEGKLSAGLIHFWPGNAIGIQAKEELPLNQWIHVTLTYDGSSRATGLQLYMDGNLAAVDVVRDKLAKEITGGGATKFALGQRFRDRGFINGEVDELSLYQRAVTPIEIRQLADDHSLTALLKKTSGELTEAERQQLYPYWLVHHSEPFRQQQTQLTSLRKQYCESVDQVAEVMVMKELSEPRTTHVLYRGAYDAPGEAVDRSTPESLPAASPSNRLGLAEWTTSPEHPLTSRVTVNRFWQMFFGQGLVQTPDDFGSQGALPTHPQLLDDLSLRFIKSGWDVKGLLKEIALSATYRQSSQTSKELNVRDPDNELLARGPRFRLSAEMIRDQALYVSGLLVDKRGGPPVKPYQPAGLWKEKSNNVYTREEGEGSHRRSLYTFWKRTSPPPAMITLDAAKRDVCSVKRQTTATPLQALVLLNDVQYVEAARAIAVKTIKKRPDNRADQLTYLFRSLTGRFPEEREIALLQQVYEEQLIEFTSQPERISQLLEQGDEPIDADVPQSEQAAMMVVAQLLLNYDEVVMRR